MTQTNGNKVPSFEGVPLHLMSKKEISKVLQAFYVKASDALKSKDEKILEMSEAMEEMDQAITGLKTKINVQQNEIAQLNRKIIDMSRR